MRIARAFDKAQALASADTVAGDRRSAVSVAGGKRAMGIQSALEWAFGIEMARVDFDAAGSHEFDRVGVSPEWRLLQEHRLGCRVDGGGTGSDPHSDAQLIAAAVEALAIDPVYGRDMVSVVAECARAGVVPDWRGQPQRRVVPQGWDLTEDGGWTAHEVDAGEWSYRGAQRQVRRGRLRVCPVSYSGGAQSVARSRRKYLDWWGALMDIRAGIWGLSLIDITGAMPPMTPWKESY